MYLVFQQGFFHLQYGVLRNHIWRSWICFELILDVLRQTMRWTSPLDPPWQKYVWNTFSQPQQTIKIPIRNIFAQLSKDTCCMDIGGAKVSSNKTTKTFVNLENLVDSGSRNLETMAEINRLQWGVVSFPYSAKGPWNKSLNFIFPTKYGIPKSLKVSHWLSSPISQESNRVEQRRAERFPNHSHLLPCGGRQATHFCTRVLTNQGRGMGFFRPKQVTPSKGALLCTSGGWRREWFPQKVYNMLQPSMVYRLIHTVNQPSTSPNSLRLLFLRLNSTLFVCCCIQVLLSFCLHHIMLCKFSCLSILRIVVQLRLPKLRHLQPRQWHCWWKKSCTTCDV